MSALFLSVVLIVLVFLLAPTGRRDHPLLPQLRARRYAHRGLHDDTLPENSMSAFRAALESGYGVELDVHLLKDGTLAVMHDSSLKRTTGCDGKIEDLTAAELAHYHLGGTQETIPTLDDVLSLFEGKAPIIIELKCVGGNHAALTDATCALLRNYKGAYCMESFDPRCVYHLKKHYPNIVRGQLAEDFFREKSTLPLAVKFLLTHNLLNFLTQPDFVAYKFQHRKHTPTNFIRHHLWHMQGVSWTLRSPEELQEAEQERLIPIFEGFRP